MKTLALLLLIACAGCAQFSTRQVAADTTGPNGEPLRTVTTDAKATAFMASKQALAGWKADQTGESQGASLNGLEQQADVEKLVRVLVDAFIAYQSGGLIKPTDSQPSRKPLLAP